MNTEIKPSPFRPRFAGRAAIVLADVACEVVPWIPVALAVLIAAGGLAGYRVVGGGNAKPAPVPPPPAPPVCPAPEKKPPDNAAKWDVASFDGAAWGD